MIIFFVFCISLFTASELLAMELNMPAQVEAVYKKSGTKLPVAKLPVIVKGDRNVNLWAAIPPHFINTQGPLYVADQIVYLLPSTSIPNMASEKITATYIRNWSTGKKLNAHLKKQASQLRDKLNAEILVSEVDSKKDYTIGKLGASYTNDKSKQLLYTFFILGSHCSNITYEITLTPQIDQAQALAKAEAFIQHNTCIE